jgi:hypothetical protein
VNANDKPTHHYYLDPLSYLIYSYLASKSSLTDLASSLLGIDFGLVAAATAMADTDPAPAPAPKGVLLKADTIAEPFLAEVKASLANLARSAPKLVGILATANAPSRSYAEFTRKQCDALGIVFELREVGAALPDGAGGTDGDGVEEAIIEANADDAVDGIMVRSYF